jgi:pimeloyl-ACP methyl ester carboxylesterase
VLDFADALGIERFIAVGQDWGARAAYAAAVLAPARVLSLIALATPFVMHRGQRDDYAQVKAYWYQWYFHLDQGRKALESDRAGFCEFLWRCWSPQWQFERAEFQAASASWTNPQFVPIVIHSYRQRHGNAPGHPKYAAAQAMLDSLPPVKVPTVFACGLADACNLSESSLGQDKWFPAGYRRIELPGVGHFVQREAPSEVADLMRQTISRKEEQSRLRSEAR